jgi:hypothetical protein
MSQGTVNEGPIAEAFDAGRRAGFAVSAVALGLVSFLSLLGAEKALLAIVLGVLAARGAPPGSSARRLGVAGVCLGALFLLTLAVVLVVFGDKLLELVELLKKLS